MCSIDRKSGLAARNAHRRGEDSWQIEREKARFLLARSGGSEKSRGVVGLGPRVVSSLSRLTTDAAGQLDVLGHDGDTLGMDGA